MRGPPHPSAFGSEPETFLTHHPRHRTHSARSPSPFPPTSPAANFQCLYAKGWAACKSPHIFRHLEPGRYRFKLEPSSTVWRIQPPSWTFKVRSLSRAKRRAAARIRRPPPWGYSPPWRRSPMRPGKVREVSKDSAREATPTHSSPPFAAVFALRRNGSLSTLLRASSSSSSSDTRTAPRSPTSATRCSGPAPSF